MNEELARLPTRTTLSTPKHHDLWRRRATWLGQAGLTEAEGAPVEVAEELAEELANAVLALLDEVHRLELERAQARAAGRVHRRWPRD